MLLFGAVIKPCTSIQEDFVIGVDSVHEDARVVVNIGLTVS